MAISMSPGSSNALQGLNMILKQIDERRRAKQELALTLLGMKIRQDEAMRDRLFTEAREVKKELLASLENLQKAQNTYNAIGGKIEELNQKIAKKRKTKYEDYDPTKGLTQILGRLSNMAAKDIQYSQKSLAEAYDKMMTLNQAYLDIEDEIGAVKNFATETALRYFDEARLLDIKYPELKKRRKRNDMSEYYHKAYVSGAEAEKMFDILGDEYDLDNARRGAILSEWRKLGDIRYPQLLQEEELDLRRLQIEAQRNSNLFKSIFGPSIDAIRQAGNALNNQYESIKWEDGESRKVIIPNDTDVDLSSLENNIKDIIADMVLFGGDKTLGIFQNLPEGIDGKLVRNFENAKTPTEKQKYAGEIVEKILNADIEDLDFSGTGKKERQKQRFLVDLINYYQMVRDTQTEMLKFHGFTQGITPQLLSNK